MHVSVNLTKGQTVLVTASDGAPSTQGPAWASAGTRDQGPPVLGAKEKSVDSDASALLFDANGALVDQVWFSRKWLRRRGAQQYRRQPHGCAIADESIRVALTGVNLAVSVDPGVRQQPTPARRSRRSRTRSAA